ncbi:MAG: hypothetical protein A2161_06145 [Candidatus Schekmanbacteria bacterium RBG_13_48_7]|uniref:DEAD/DEAH box helicase n=1 Tax=Candidatus Schekmanbacteria bacterium RBG_13_48_7 TaxID=1817878 RepID=A0A1F7RTD7_9BACT|nr:MAG: hypothetical protein A2161_06145 [Candidatus Schekmanbacteria bacterium RBG_13_48_7]
MDVFNLRNQLVGDYSSFIRGFINIRDSKINKKVEEELNAGLLWPDPLIQLNPSFESGDSIAELVEQGILHKECNRIFRIKEHLKDSGSPMRLYKHQSDAIRAAQTGNNYVLTTGTGSGKSLAYIIPIVDHVVKNGTGKGVQAIIIYPMNALANSQAGELQKFLSFGYPDGKCPVTFQRYTGQDSDEQKDEIIASPPDIILTNYVMLELILTRPREKKLIHAAEGLRFLVLDELHTYRGRQGADVAFLVRRTRDRLKAENLQCIGTSATLATGGTYIHQRQEIANVATQLFGSEVKAENVIGESLMRATPEIDISDLQVIDNLRECIDSRGTACCAQNSATHGEGTVCRANNGGIPDKGTACCAPTTYEEFIKDPLASWIETTFGITSEQESGRLIRQKPRSITGENGVALELSESTGVHVNKCSDAIQDTLLAGYTCSPNPIDGTQPFAFRLHQFLSRGDTVYASLESESQRHITVQGQQFVPGNKEALLYPLVFCRECGHEYYCVRKTRDDEGEEIYIARNFHDYESDEFSDAGYLYFNTEQPWPEKLEEIYQQVPEDWLEDNAGTFNIKKSRRDYLPRILQLKPDGKSHSEGIRVQYISTPFRFCLRCGVEYDPRSQRDFSKLSALGTEGRSTATTILCQSAVLRLRNDESLVEKARKLLSFTDNRQDASLQAGHFNDFIETSLIRAALYSAAEKAGSGGLTHDVLPQKLFEALNLPLSMYVVDSTVRFQALNDAKQAFRNILAYRVYRDLKRGWRILAPNLEQCGLLKIEYQSLDEICNAEDVWENFHPALSQATPETRRYIAKALLDFTRRELAIDVENLNKGYQERIQSQSYQHLIPPWAIDENETMEFASTIYPRSTKRGDYGGDVYLSARSRFGGFLRKGSTLHHLNGILNLEETGLVIQQLLEALRIAGLLKIVKERTDKDDVPGYQIPASALRWVAGDGSEPFFDPIRVPNKSSEGAKPNSFFIDQYKSAALGAKGLTAHEHTAQVPSDTRIKREDDFREGRLPILFCSPTMELGVDISELNVVNMRNVPPTPANYAQRSGRAGRSGQPALVFTYCTVGRPHDQYFFKRPEQMVSGFVQPPRMDLANEDLVKSHIQAIWLAETGLDLGKSLADILDIGGDNPSLLFKQNVQDQINNKNALLSAKQRATGILLSIKNELDAADWYHENWLDDFVSQHIIFNFHKKCDRWRNLYLSALKQQQEQNAIIIDATRNAEDKKRAARLRREAESQLKLLTDVDNLYQSDFYSYRYFAGEGFLPGYNFPRLPLSAYIPGRRVYAGRDEFLSRARFIAISEFGPHSYIYHEGSRYEIKKVILPVEGEDGVRQHKVKLCGNCGYVHEIDEGDGPDLCEFCKTELHAPMNNLFQMENVSTIRRDKINSDEEERFRLGYDLLTGLRFADLGHGPSFSMATIEDNSTKIAEIRYGQSATIWRINLGWKRRKQQNLYGFLLDIERGAWTGREIVDDEDSPASPRVTRVIPYVDDRKNCLIMQLENVNDVKVMASLQAALKNGILVCYQLEDNELAAEPLPGKDDRRLILFYEAAEGGAGVLRQIVKDKNALSVVADAALQLCHFNPETGDDLKRAEGAKEDCESACYSCLLSYANQMDHMNLDRYVIRDILMQLKGATVNISPGSDPPIKHLEKLKNLCDSDLERKWLDFLNSHKYRLPSHAQKLVEACKTRPDFIFNEEQVAIYVDGPYHEYPERQSRDVEQTTCMEDLGYTVIRFSHTDNWHAIIDKYPNVFGKNG